MTTYNLISADSHIVEPGDPWAGDYPHNDSTWPRSREMIDRLFEGVREQEKSRIVAGNAVKLYGFE